MNFLDDLQKHAAAIGVLIAAAPIVWGVVVFGLSRRAESARFRFETYHNLIKQLVDRETPEQTMKLDRQVAIIFELRHFRHYRPVTRRILLGLKEHWASNEYGPADKRARLLREVDLTLADLKRSWFSRLINRHEVDAET